MVNVKEEITNRRAKDYSVIESFLEQSFHERFVTYLKREDDITGKLKQLVIDLKNMSSNSDGCTPFKGKILKLSVENSSVITCSVNNLVVKMKALDYSMILKLPSVIRNSNDENNKLEEYLDDFFDEIIKAYLYGRLSVEG
jgi:hypothetical protein